MAGVERIVNFLRGIDIPSEDIPMDDIPSVDLGFALRQFFSRADIQKRMVEMNTDRLYSEQGNRNYQQLGIYADKTAKHKRKYGLPDHYYTYYETGKTHESLRVYAEADSVAIYPDHESAPEYAHFALDGNAWGLNVEHWDELMPKVVVSLQDGIRDFLETSMKD
jgi:hypothetical protein